MDRRSEGERMRRNRHCFLRDRRWEDRTLRIEWNRASEKNSSLQNPESRTHPLFWRVRRQRHLHCHCLLGGLRNHVAVFKLYLAVCWPDDFCVVTIAAFFGTDVVYSVTKDICLRPTSWLPAPYLHYESLQQNMSSSPRTPISEPPLPHSVSRILLSPVQH